MADINYIDNIGIGKISRFITKKDAIMDVIPFASQDSDKTEAVDTLGVVKYFDFTTNIIGTFETINNTIYLLDQIIDGAQFGYSILFSPYIVAKENDIRKRGGYGTTTGYAYGKLIDTNMNFTVRGISSSISAGADKVKNLITGEVATITGIDSATQLDLSNNIFTSSGIPYVFTVNCAIKLLKVEPIWEPPALNKCLINIGGVQVTRLK